MNQGHLAVDHASKNFEPTSKADQPITNHFSHPSPESRLHDTPSSQIQADAPVLAPTPKDRTQDNSLPTSSNRQSGGFLLQPTWQSVRRASKKLSGRNGTASTPEHKRKAKDVAVSDIENQIPDGLAKDSRTSRPGSSTEPVLNLHDLQVKRARISTPDRPISSATSSSKAASANGLPNGFSYDSSTARNSQTRDSYVSSADSRQSNSSAIDASQLVRVALSLNESRRLHLSPGQIASVDTPAGRRAVSLGLNPTHAPALLGGYHQHTPDRHSRDTRSASPNPRFSGGASPSTHSSERYISTSVIPSFPEHEYQFSHATLARAEKARVFFELCHQYRRALEVVPPLKDTENKTSAQISLGRPYNPLQYIRNRRARVRERQELDGAKSGWADLRNVDTWMSALEESKQASPVSPMPKWSFQGLNHANFLIGAAARDFGFSSGIGKAKIDWRISPADLLADLYWIEQDSHKNLIENSHGDKIFPKTESDDHPTGGAGRRRVQSDTSKTDRGTDDEPSFDASAADASSPISPKTQQHAGPSDDDSPKQRFFGRRKHNRAHRFKGHIIGRRREDSINHSDLSDSEDERGVGVSHARSPESYGPLEAHMSKLLQQENDQQKFPGSRPRKSQASDSHARRLGISGDTNEKDFEPTATQDALDHVKTIEESYRPPQEDSRDPLRRSAHHSRSSSNIEHFRGFQGRHSRQGSKEQQGLGPAFNESRHSRQSSKPFNFLHRRRSNEMGAFSSENIASSRAMSYDGDEADRALSQRSSLNFSSRNASYQNLANLANIAGSASGSASIEEFPKSPNRPKSPARQQTGKGFFKSGRIGEIVRGERANSSVTAATSRKGSTRNNSVSSLASRNESELSKSTEDPPTSPYAPRSKGRSSDASKRPSHHRSRSSNDVKDAKVHAYHMNNLPAFVSTKTPVPQEEQTQEEKRTSMEKQRKRPSVPRANTSEEIKRTKTKRPPPEGLKEESSDVSLNTSSPDLTRLQSRKSYGFPKGDRNSYDTSSWLRRDSSHRFLKPSAALESRRQSSSPSNSRSPSGRPRDIHRQWSIADSQIPAAFQAEADAKVSPRDVAFVRSLLLSSAVKANAIVHRANQMVDPPSKFLLDAAKACGQADSIKPARKREEHVVAARMLSRRLEESIQTFESKARDLHSNGCTGLRAQISDLQQLATAKLSPQVRTVDEDADAFIARLTTTHTLAIKQVNDSVDAMLRKRRRRLRRLASAGFKLLELTMVGLLWFIWLFVLVLRIVRGVVKGLYKGTRWMLWL